MDSMHKSMLAAKEQLQAGGNMRTGQEIKQDHQRFSNSNSRPRQTHVNISILYGSLMSHTLYNFILFLLWLCVSLLYISLVGLPFCI